MWSKDRIAHILFVVFLLILAGFKCGSISSPQDTGMGPDEMVHLGNYMVMKNYLDSGSDIRTSPLKTSIRKPHLPYYAAYLVSLAYPQGFSAAVLSNILFGLLWLLVIYLIGAKVFDPLLSLIGIVVLSSFWHVQFLIDHFGNDIQSSFFVVLIVWFILDYKRLVGFRWWPVLGLLFGLGLLTKPTLPLYVGLPLLILFVRNSYLMVSNRQWVPALSLLGGVGIAAIVAYVIWTFLFPGARYEIFELLKVISEGMGRDFEAFHNIPGETFYEDMGRCLGWPGALLVFFGVAISFFQLKDKERILLFSAFLPAFLLLVVLAEAFTRLLNPVLFVPVLFALQAIRSLPWKRLAKGAPVVVGLIFLALFFMDHRNASFCFWPHHARQNVIYNGDQVADELSKRLTKEKPVSVMYLNFCDFPEMPVYYYTLLSVQSLAGVEQVFLWDTTEKFPGIDLNQPLIRTMDQVRYLLVCGGEVIDQEKIERRLADALKSSRIMEAPYNEMELPAIPSFRHRQTFEINYGQGGIYQVELWERDSG